MRRQSVKHLFSHKVQQVDLTEKLKNYNIDDIIEKIHIDSPDFDAFFFLKTLHDNPNEDEDV